MRLSISPEFSPSGTIPGSSWALGTPPLLKNSTTPRSEGILPSCMSVLGTAIDGGPRAAGARGLRLPGKYRRRGSRQTHRHGRAAHRAATVPHYGLARSPACCDEDRCGPIPDRLAPISGVTSFSVAEVAALRSLASATRGGGTGAVRVIRTG